MAIAYANTRTKLAAAYATANPNGTILSADPGSGGAVTSELTGGSPAYARKALNWGTAASSAVTGAATAFDIPSGSTAAYFAPCASATLGTADLGDKVALSGQTFSSQGTFTITPTYTQS